MTQQVFTASATTSADDINPRYPGEAGMWFFILGDLLIFGVYFLAYVLYRNQHLPEFLHSQQLLDQTLGVLNTVILLTSSLLVALATEAVRLNKKQQGGRLLLFAIVLGSLFPVLKLAEWIPKILAGHTPGENLFFMFYYVMTGLHLIHVLAGLTILGFMLRELKYAATPKLQFIETGGIYWHMVDVLWLFLLAVFYLMR